MKLGTLNAKNPEYDADTWCQYEALYRGGKCFREHIGRFLTRNPSEPADVFKQRSREAHYRSYVGPIVDFFAAQLMSAPLTIRAISKETDEPTDPDPFYAKLKEDVDGLGADLVDFARDSFRAALVKRWCWWLASVPSNDGIEPANRQEWQDRKLGDAKLSFVEPECILDWECDEAGDLIWALHYEETCPRPMFGASRAIRKMVWRLYDRDGVETFELLYDPSKGPLDSETVVSSRGKVPHGFDRVPMVKVEVPEGLWLMNRVADAQVEHFKLSSGLGWAIRRTCYAMPVYKMSGGVSADGSPANQPHGTGYYIQIGQDDSMEWQAPPDGPFGVISDEIKSQKDEIYRVAQQMAHGVDNNAAAIGRSGDSKQADVASTEVCLRAYGSVMREAIEKALDLVADGRKDPIRFSVTGLDKFNLSDAKATVENVTTALALQIPSRTLKEELFLSAADALLPNISQDRKDLIAKEIAEGLEEQDEIAKAEHEDAEKKLDAEEPADGDAEDEGEPEDDGKMPKPDDAEGPKAKD